MPPRDPRPHPTKTRLASYGPPGRTRRVCRSLLPIRQNYDCIYKLVQFIREDRRRQPESSPSPARVLSESRPESFPESYGIPSLSRVPSESSPSPVRVFVEAKNHQKRLGKTRPSPFPSPPSRLKRAKHDAEAQESIKARRNRIHPARHAKRQSAPLLNQIKEEPKPEVTEPLKQEESQELSKLPDEEQPDRYRDLVRSDSVEVAREIKCRSKSSAHVGCFVA